MFGLACSFAKCYPNARLVSGERDVDHWLPSVKFMFCRWYDCHALKQGRDHEHIQRLIYGEAVDQFCAHQEDLCGDAGVTKSPQWHGVEQSLRAFHAAHAESLSCVDESRLLRYNLGDADVATRIAGFL